MKSSKQDWSSPRLKFFLQEEAEVKAVPKDIDGIHKLARYLLNKFISIRGFDIAPEGKFKFMQEVFYSDINKEMSIDESIPALAGAIINVYDIRKNLEESKLMGRDTRHVEYSIKKELERIWEEYSA
jgi:hypothetical protein